MPTPGQPACLCIRRDQGAGQRREAVVEVGLDHGEALPAQQLEHLRVVVDARHRGVGVPPAQQPATCAGAGAEVNDAARSRHPGQVQDGCEVVAEHLGIEVEDAVLVMTAGLLVGLVVVPRLVGW